MFYELALQPLNHNALGKINLINIIWFDVLKYVYLSDPVYNNIGSSNELEPAEYASVIPKSQRVNQQPKTLNSEVNSHC